MMPKNCFFPVIKDIEWFMHRCCTTHCCYWMNFEIKKNENDLCSWWFQSCFTEKIMWCMFQNSFFACIEVHWIVSSATNKIATPLFSCQLQMTYFPKKIRLIGFVRNAISVEIYINILLPAFLFVCLILMPFNRSKWIMDDIVKIRF